jgi:gamma-glutamylcyclotransferase (GGCT)/AIG2-like uncharacterized protein YtfP
MVITKVFVYGTLKPGEVNYQRYCQGKVIHAQAAIARGQLYDLPLGYPAMILGEGWVKGFVLTFDNPEILDILDELEAYSPHRPPTANEYQRCQIEALTLMGHSLGFVWAYLMNDAQVKAIAGQLVTNGVWQSSESSI